jgi:hypothetical protein
MHGAWHNMTRGMLDPHVSFPGLVSLGVQVMTKDGRNKLSVCRDLPLPSAKATSYEWRYIHCWPRSSLEQRRPTARRRRQWSLSTSLKINEAIENPKPCTPLAHQRCKDGKGTLRGRDQTLEQGTDPSNSSQNPRSELDKCSPTVCLSLL